MKSIYINDLEWLRSITTVHVDTPDGIQEVGGTIVKEEPCSLVVTDNTYIEVADNHAFLSDTWCKVEDLKVGDQLQSRNGLETIQDIIPTETKKVYDFEVLHPNHRYYSEGLISHNTGKSLMALVAALARTRGQRQHKVYDTIAVTRPPLPVDRSLQLGFLPGPQPLWSKVLTPSGWTTMGELKVGQEVIGRDGQPHKIKSVHPQGIREVYRITTDTGKRTYACGSHLWQTHEYGKPDALKTTLDIRESLNTQRHYLPSRDPARFRPPEQLPVTPYMLGCLLGNGIAEFSTLRKPAYIPEAYLRSSIEDRRELLRGLIGTSNEYYTTSDVIRGGVVDLVQSLGGSTEVVDHMIRINLDAKPDAIQSVEPAGEEEVQCIALEGDEHLYITDDYIVTHNTLEDKMGAWLHGIRSNLKFLYERTDKDKRNNESEEVFETYFEPISLENIQGMSLHDTILLVDEYQLTSVNVLKQVLSRISQGSKVVLIGDDQQTYGANRGCEGRKKLLPHIKDSELISYVQLQNIYRSELAEFVEEIFA